MPRQVDGLTAAIRLGPDQSQGSPTSIKNILDALGS